MNARDLKHAIAAGLLALSAAAHAATASYAAQDMDNSLACCLASEWTLTAPAKGQEVRQAQSRHDLSPNAPAPGTHRCQTALGDLSCCVGAEWVLKETAEPATAAATLTPETDRAEEFCCLASEYFVR